MNMLFIEDKKFKIHIIICNWTWITLNPAEKREQLKLEARSSWMVVGTFFHILLLNSDSLVCLGCCNLHLLCSQSDHHMFFWCWVMFWMHLDSDTQTIQDLRSISWHIVHYISIIFCEGPKDHYSIKCCSS